MEMRMDLEIWVKFLSNTAAFCRPFIDYSRVIEARELDFYTDASKNPNLGFGGRFGQAYMIQQWDKQFIINENPSIMYLELYAVVAAVLAWIHKFENSRIVIYTDNKGTKSCVNNFTSSCKNCMVLIRILVLKQMIHNTRIFARYVESSKNGPADALSRLNYGRYLRLVKGKTDRQKTEVPKELWPIKKIWVK